ncbi:MAG: hypothetical protein ABJC09_14895 [Terriglobia bacterium]
MARLRPILKALATVGKRERKTFGSISTNNFFWVTILLLRQAGTFLYLLAALVVLFPLSADPLRRIPPERLALWPLSGRDRRLLRVLSPWLNPVTWGLLLLAAWCVWHTESVGVLLLGLALFGAGFFVPAFSGEPRYLNWIPAVGGTLGQLVRKNLREMLLTLDIYVAILLSVAGVAYRMWVRPFPPEALLMITLLIVLALSSYAQCLFGLESDGGMTRYRLMPLPGWRILAAKDIAFLIVILIVTAPLSPIAGLAAGLAALAIGHAPSVDGMREQTRWRFSTGGPLGVGAFQVVAMTGAGVTASRITPLILIPCALACAGSAWWYGRRL